jgi:hypothetical protein
LRTGNTFAKLEELENENRIMNISIHWIKRLACGVLAVLLLAGSTDLAQAVLVGHWTFDDGTANDSSGMGHHGTLEGAGAAIVDDPIRGLVYSGNGLDSKVELGNPAGLNIVGQFTAAAWVKPNVLPQNGVGAILQRGHQTSPVSREFSFRVNGGDYEFITWTPTIGPEIVAPAGDEDWWVHLAGTMTEDPLQPGMFTYRLYRNGMEVAMVEGAPGLFNDFSVGWAIGARGGVTGTEREFNGLIDDVRMYDNPLSAAEIIGIMGDIPVKGDVNGDGEADLDDYAVIRDHLHMTGAMLEDGDANLDGTVNLIDFRFWKSNRTDLGAGAGQGGTGLVPEPSSVALLLLGIIGFATRRVTRR